MFIIKIIKSLLFKLGFTNLSFTRVSYGLGILEKSGNFAKFGCDSQSFVINARLLDVCIGT